MHLLPGQSQEEFFEDDDDDGDGDGNGGKPNHGQTDSEILNYTTAVEKERVRFSIFEKEY